MTTALTLPEIRALPATIDPATAARVLGVSRSTVYEWIRTGTFPGRVISVKYKHRVITASLVQLLGDSQSVESGLAALIAERDELKARLTELAELANKNGTARH